MVAIETEKYPWYETVEGDSLAQGDLLRGYKIVIPKTLPGEETVPFEAKTFDLVVMTQTCDIEEGKVTSVLLCPWWELWSFIDAAKAKGENWGKDIRDDLRKGNIPGYHLLNEASQDGLNIGLGVVDFHEIYTTPTELVREFAKVIEKRLRLLPPYREHLAQSFARFFMRVGLPTPIAKEKVAKKPPIGKAGS